MRGPLLSTAHGHGAAGKDLHVVLVAHDVWAGLARGPRVAQKATTLKQATKDAFV